MLILTLALPAALALASVAMAQTSAPPAPASEPLEEVRVGEGVILHQIPATQPSGLAPTLESQSASAPATAPAVRPLSGRLNRPRTAPLAPMNAGEQSSRLMAGNAKQPTTQILLPDRSMVVDRPGSLVRNESGAWEFQFDRLPTDRLPVGSLEMLPTQLLAGMEQAVAEKAPARVLFRVSGEVTNYHDRRYLLVTRALIEELPESEPATMPETQPASMPATLPSQPTSMPMAGR